MNIKAKIKAFLIRFKNDKRGVGWVLGMAVLAIFILPFIYFPLDYAFDQVYGAITQGYTFTGVTAEAINVVQVVISYMMAFSLLIIINWSVTQAKAKRYEA